MQNLISGTKEKMGLGKKSQQLLEVNGESHMIILVDCITITILSNY